jgi:hypothetical protein
MPDYVRVGRRGVRYPLADLLAWSRRRGERLRWVDVPASIVLPVFDAYEAQGMKVPADLAALRARVRSGRG